MNRLKTNLVISNAGTSRRYRSDGKCGADFPLPNGTPGQCDPDGANPCCDSDMYRECGNTTEHCSCSRCTNYTRIYKDWEESGSTQKWRYDGRCGADYPLPDGTVSQCDPDGDKPCCSHYWNGDCGNTADHCSCRYCTNYTRVYREWEESGGTQKWRYDGQCGGYNRLPDGTPAQCDPEGANPCCSNSVLGLCGKTALSCFCWHCTNYRRIYRDWKESGGTQKWRYDGRCGRSYPLPDGTPAQCDPDGNIPCCSNGGSCSLDKYDCLCTDCVDYRIVREIEKSGDNCTLVRLSTEYLKHVCYDDLHKNFKYKCETGDNYYQVNCVDFGDISVTEVCDNDQHFYQVCGFNTEITNTDVLCGGYICEEKEGGEHKYIKCTGDNCKPENRDCSTTRDTSSETNCDGNCKYKYGVTCAWRGTRKIHVPVDGVCDGYEDCDDGSDEQDCTVTNNTVYTCTHYSGKVWDNEKLLTVPILNYTRCSAFDVSTWKIPYCLNYLDQTNCSDTERVGGYCEVNGYMSTVSKYMVCYDYDMRLEQSVTLCDDGIQNKCVSPSTSECRVHKHLMCNGVEDCPDRSDESHQMCRLTTEEINFACKRRFSPKSAETRLPITWIMDNVTDCINGEDENLALWVVCPGNVITPAEFSCQNVYFCPGVEDVSVFFTYLCNGIDSCGNGAENKVCEVARDFPFIDTTASMSSDLVRNVCSSTDCEKREFIRPWGSVFETKIELLVPKGKVNCNRLFGEHYLYLSCMGLCMGSNISCPLNGETRKLQYNSCPGQYPGRAYTLGNNSFLTFVDKSENGHYHQNFYRCNNNRCIQYNQVCDLVDDCGDMSDEINCANQMTCEDAKIATTHKFLSWSQKCDGIYDCFDLSDECNESCGRQILENWVLKCVCWLMGILAVIFNVLSSFHGLSSLKNCQTAGMMTSKVLLILIALGDFLMGLYLIILSFYDSLIFQQEFCKGQTEWLTGVPCLVLGVISTVGSQVSLFSMTVFSFIRMYGLIYRSMRIPGPVNKKSLTKVTLLASAILISSLAIALIPLVPFLQDYFVQGMYYDPSYQVFIGFPTKGRHIDVLKAYYNYSNSSMDKITEGMSWKDIGEKVDGMFSQNYGYLDRKPVHFYGNDGVCLFKYFVRTDDARRSRRSPGSGVEMNDPVVWTMLIVNLICFIIMTYCYIRIIRNTRQSTQTSGQYDNPERLRENRAMEKRIMVIIGTDFLCWVPFIFISGLHNLGAINASSWYTSFAMTVLPLNSVVNPLIYDKAIGEFIIRNFYRLIAIIRPKIATAVLAITGLFRTRNNNNEPENIPMEIINPPQDSGN